VHTPLVPPSPTKTHHRTPSMLRTLAHYPPLSVLRSKTKAKNKRKSKNLPPLPSLTLTPDMYGRLSSGDYNSRDSYDSTGVEASPSPRKLKKGSGSGSLKGSQSLPRDLRISGERSPIGEWYDFVKFDDELILSQAREATKRYIISRSLLHHLLITPEHPVPNPNKR
jgi:hypothetical protein